MSLINRLIPMTLNDEHGIQWHDFFVVFCGNIMFIVMTGKELLMLVVTQNTCTCLHEDVICIPLDC